MQNQILKTVGILAGAAILACAAGPSMATDITMAYAAASMQYPFNVAVAKGFQEVAKELGAKTVVLDPRGSVERQGNAIDDLIAQKLDGISAIVLDSVVSQSWVDPAADTKLSRRCRPTGRRRRASRSARTSLPRIRMST